MRITVAEKSATRQRILDAAVAAFCARGFEATTTRDIAQSAGIAAGTLFNYFATKEAIVQSLAQEALHKAWSDMSAEPLAKDLSEALFALVAAELRQLRPLRKYLLPLLESSLSPLAAQRSSGDDDLRQAHLELVHDLLRQHGVVELPPLALQVYWTLYTGVLAFWAGDKSPKQEDTLALLDQSL